MASYETYDSYGRRETLHRSRIYSDMSGLYDHVFDRVFRRRIQTVVRQLGIPPGARVLEVGIGTGLSLDAYPGHCHVTGIDLSKEMLDHADRKRDPFRHAHIELVQMDGMNTAFPSDHFDFVTAFHVVTVVPDPQRLVDEMTRVCKPSGQVVIINHFSSRRPLIRNLVNLADPVTRKLGWSTKLNLDDVMDGSDLNLESRYKTSPWSLFTIVEARKFAPASPAS
ncbi:MAG: class I SAM-dependent methyltransferase [Myxococcales bacterium]|nr:MAG: class I SAM-dependent methyltransferase [Myxococcales bacterium]